MPQLLWQSIALMKHFGHFLLLLLMGSSCIVAQQSPASRRPPQTLNPQSFPKELVAAGQTRFASQCGFCHGRDASGGETGPDLTRSKLVSEDSSGDKIGPVVRAGRLDKGMPAFELNEAEISAVAAFIHDQKTKAEAVGGGRRSVDVSDLDHGNAEAGQKYFNGAGKCSQCHSPTGDLAGIASRFQGLTLLQRMLNPSGSRPAPAPAKVTLVSPSGETITGTLVAQDEFTVTIKDAAGTSKTSPLNQVKVSVDDPLSVHFDLLERYTDDDMHNVYAYLQTLR
jgi:cytochrome c oxidase cbb3-type subunit 3